MDISRLRSFIDKLNIPEKKDLLKKCDIFNEFKKSIITQTEGLETYIKIPQKLAKIKNGYSIFGVYIEAMISLMFSKCCNTSGGLIKNVHYSDSIITGKLVAKKADIFDYFDGSNYEQLKILEKFVLKIICQKLDAKFAEFNAEIISVSEDSSGIFSAHPDILIKSDKNDVIVCEIKTTHKWDAKEMLISTILQILSYVAIMIWNNNKVDYFCIILPLQKRTIKGYVGDIKKVDIRDFMDGLFKTMNIIEGKSKLMEIAITKPQINIDKVGSHIPKYKSIYESITNFYSNRPLNVACQIFLSSPQRIAKTNITQTDINSTKQYIDDTHVHVYVHSPYYINLSNPMNIKPEETESWSLNKLSDELNFASKMGLKGVVVHVGKAMKQKISDAKKVMLESMLTTLKNVPDDVDLILETGASQGTEICIKPDEIVDMYNNVTQTYQNFSICVDTCHVFASGYLPDEYMKQLLDSNVRISLVHFNGSKMPIKSHLDRHMFVNLPTQKIPIINMKNVLKMCEKYNIDAIIE